MAATRKKQDPAALESISVAFVTFEHEESKRRCLEDYRYSRRGFCRYARGESTRCILVVSRKHPLLSLRPQSRPARHRGDIPLPTLQLLLQACSCSLGVRSYTSSERCFQGRFHLLKQHATDFSLFPILLSAPHFPTPLPLAPRRFQPVKLQFSRKPVEEEEQQQDGQTLPARRGRNKKPRPQRWRLKVFQVKRNLTKR